MEKLVHVGFDGLDIAFKGALSIESLETLESALKIAKSEKAAQRVALGPNGKWFTMEKHGKQGGYAFTLTDGDTGALYSIKRSNAPSEWNIFVSVRAACFLVRPYGQVKAYVIQTLKDMGARIADISVNRIDLAIDIHTEDFDLDLKQFITPARSKARLYWSSEQYLFDDGEKFSAVMSGAKFQSATIGKMPNRQVILYDKGQAAIDLKQPYWFKAWGLDRETMTGKVWRVEIRAGRGALEKGLTKRSFDDVDAYLPTFVDKALSNIRYVETRDGLSNVSRAKTHPLWELAQNSAQTILEHREPPMLDEDVKAIMRQQRAKMIQVKSRAVWCVALRSWAIARKPYMQTCLKSRAMR